MPKIKTNRSAAKRLKTTKKGKIKRWHAFSGHIKTKKGPKKRRKLSSSTFIDKADEKKFKKLIPYV